MEDSSKNAIFDDQSDSFVMRSLTKRFASRISSLTIAKYRELSMVNA